MHAKNVLASYLSELLLLPSRCHDPVVAGSTRVAVALSPGSKSPRATCLRGGSLTSGQRP